MTDSKYFTTTKKGEIFELKSELNNDKKEKKKEAVKKVIASMTVGKDVSALFPDVVNCMQTDNLELKKLVYLYLMNYAKSQPDMAIMAVNTFVKVSTQTKITSSVCYSLRLICYVFFKIGPKNSYERPPPPPSAPLVASFNSLLYLFFCRDEDLPHSQLMKVTRKL